MLKKLTAQKDAFEKTSEWLELWGWIFAIIVVIGVAGEAVIGISAYLNSKRAKTVQKQIDQENELEMARLNNDTEKLKAANNALVGQQIQDIVDSSARAIVPDSPETKKLEEDLKKFRNRSIKLEYIKNNGESWNFASELLMTMNRAENRPASGPTPVESTLSTHMGGPLFGFEIRHGNKVSEDLIKELRRDIELVGGVGITALDQAEIFKTGRDDDEVVIVVGLNPRVGTMPPRYWEYIRRSSAAVKAANPPATSPASGPSASPR